MSRALGIITAFLLLLGSCVGGEYVRTEGLETTEGVSGAFRLILFGGAYLHDFEAVAVLDLEGDGYRIVPHAPAHRYSVSEGLDARTAFAKARHFALDQMKSNGVLLKRVLDMEGAAIAYEVRPLYQAFAFGLRDIMDVSYYLREGGEVRMVVRLRDEVDRMRDEEGEGYIWGR